MDAMNFFWPRACRPCRWGALLAALAWCVSAAAARDAAVDARVTEVFGAGVAGPDGTWTLSREKVLRQPGTSRERTALPAGTTVRLSQALRVHEGGRPHDVLLWDARMPRDASDGGFNGEAAVVAVFAAGRTAPIDVADVKTDRDTSFPERALLKLSALDDAFAVHNTHANAGQPYTSASLFHLRQGRLRRIAVVDLLGEMSGCARAFDEILDWQTEPDLAPLPVIVARVTLVHAPRGSTGSCDGRPPPERRETFEGRWRWDAPRGQYVSQRGTLERLERWNDRRR